MSENIITYPAKERNSAVFQLGDDSSYQTWRALKLSNFSTLRKDISSDLPDKTSGELAGESIVTVTDLANPQDVEISQILDSCRKTNMAIYQVHEPIAPQKLEKILEKFCLNFGLKTMENHRSAGNSGVVAIEQTTIGGKGGYIPYTDKPLSWHTDGYYNAPENRIRAMVLHCARDASEGGVNELLDPEIAYIRLRDENPQFIASLMHPQAMIIPANEDPRSAYRPDSIGPVFEVDNQTGHLHMRYSARARNIIWRDDPITDQARAFLSHILKNDPLIVRHKLHSGQGVISNNVLHNRTGFVDTGDVGETRLMYRIRYMERVRDV